MTVVYPHETGLAGREPDPDGTGSTGEGPVGPPVTNYDDGDRGAVGPGPISIESAIRGHSVGLPVGAMLPLRGESGVPDTDPACDSSTTRA